MDEGMGEGKGTLTGTRKSIWRTSPSSALRDGKAGKRGCMSIQFLELRARDEEGTANSKTLVANSSLTKSRTYLDYSLSRYASRFSVRRTRDGDADAEFERI